ncbi:hypothetical protein PIB30_013891 [Stylosanthes scabra]|uniref:Uncharacterized protein n=1 Tax=Stylosanthes scabra TaxID=79078 RepID=A0ABU6V950_9FABA|nr:hypothetical protein [Stylosanthes scabra]
MDNIGSSGASSHRRHGDCLMEVAEVDKGSSCNSSSSANDATPGNHSQSVRVFDLLEENERSIKIIVVFNGEKAVGNDEGLMAPPNDVNLPNRSPSLILNVQFSPYNLLLVGYPDDMSVAMPSVHLCCQGGMDFPFQILRIRLMKLSWKSKCVLRLVTSARAAWVVLARAILARAMLVVYGTRERRSSLPQYAIVELMRYYSNPPPIATQIADHNKRNINTNPKPICQILNTID